MAGYGPSDLRNERECRRCGYTWYDEMGEYRSCPNCAEHSDD